MATEPEPPLLLPTAPLHLTPIRDNNNNTHDDTDDFPPYAKLNIHKLSGILAADVKRGRIFLATNLHRHDSLLCIAPDPKGVNTATETMWKAEEPFDRNLNPVFRVQMALLSFSGEILLMRRVADLHPEDDGEHHLLTRHDPNNQLMPVPCPALEAFSHVLARRPNNRNVVQLTAIDERRVWVHTRGRVDSKIIICYILSFGARVEDVVAQTVVLRTVAQDSHFTCQGFASRDGVLCVIYEFCANPSHAPADWYYYPLPTPDDRREEITIEAIYTVHAAKIGALMPNAIPRSVPMSSRACGSGSALRVDVESNEGITGLVHLPALVVRDQRTMRREPVAVWQLPKAWPRNMVVSVAGYAEPGVLYVFTMPPSPLNIKTFGAQASGVWPSDPSAPKPLSRIDRLWFKHIDWHVARGYPGLIPRDFMQRTRALVWLRWREDTISGATTDTNVIPVSQPNSAASSSQLWGSLPLEIFEYVLAEAWRAFLAPMVVVDARW